MKARAIAALVAGALALAACATASYRVCDDTNGADCGNVTANVVIDNSL